MARAYGTKIVRDGIIFQLDSINKKSYPGSGTTWYDLSNNKTDVSLLNNASFENNGISFDGINQYGVTNNRVNTDQSFTIDAVFKNNTMNDGGIVTQKDETFTIGGEWGIGINYNDLEVFVTFINSGGDSSSIGMTLYPHTLTTGTWHATFTYDRTSQKMRIYLNGILMREYTTSVSSSSNVNTQAQYLSIGRRIDRDDNEFFDGEIYSTKIYNRSLTAEEIKHNHYSMSKLFTFSEI